MFVPFYDANRLRHIRFQYVTVGLIAANALVYLLAKASGETGAFLSAFEISYGFIPAVVNGYAELPPAYVAVPGWLNFLTYSFLHLDIWHIGGNMLFLWVFGDNVEDAFGHVKFLVFYLACAAAGAGLHALMFPGSEATLIGASGAVSGVAAAYLMLHPRVWVWVLAFGRIPLNLPAWLLLIVWIGLQFVLFASGAEDVSYAAHAGGILAGVALTLVLRRRGVVLFDRQIQTPRAVELETSDTGRS
ncbi:rhomboid family intramembrane serine protease [Aurantimonas coralicida]|uniref:rhomboid family intramembrane serine protease n=1 Tax=Aurantimonas coralicida TaxID=182270 RepID=UPI0023A325AA|nr:rhomboid family intramembrane serine protease [Aurantimonas coralicida]MDE0925386.1 rhomboid family intramembrane serine protease [Aurantimonas coralicida]